MLYVCLDVSQSSCQTSCSSNCFDPFALHRPGHCGLGVLRPFDLVSFFPTCIWHPNCASPVCCRGQVGDRGSSILFCTSSKEFCRLSTSQFTHLSSSQTCSSGLHLFLFAVRRCALVWDLEKALFLFFLQSFSCLPPVQQLRTIGDPPVICSFPFPSCFLPRFKFCFDPLGSANSTKNSVGEEQLLFPDGSFLNSTSTFLGFATLCPSFFLFFLFSPTISAYNLSIALPNIEQTRHALILARPHGPQAFISAHVLALRF